jgi:hypothetical protein
VQKKSLNFFSSRISIQWPVLFFLCCFYSASIAQLIVSEIYRDPPGTESAIGGGASHEFVEITNLGPTSVKVDSLFITNGLESDSLIAVRDTIPGHENYIYAADELPPGAIALCIDPDYTDVVSTDVSLRFPVADGTILLECGDREFGSSGLASSHGIALYRGTKSRIDSLLCSAADPGQLLDDPDGGRITLSDPPDKEGYSLVARNVLSSAPEYIPCPTSVSPGSFDPLREGWLCETEFLEFDTSSGTVSCSLRVRSVSEPLSDPVKWALERENSGTFEKVSDGTLTLSERTGRSKLIFRPDSTTMRITLDVSGTPAWNIDLSTVWLPDNSLRITEIFPKATSGEPEWFEILNCTAMPVNLRNWSFGNDEDTTLVTDIPFVIEPGHYAVITRDGTALAGRYPGLENIVTPPHWHTLDNNRDTLALFDAGMRERERVCYDGEWFSEWGYQSIERNDNDEGCSSESWVVAARASAGQPNDALYWRNTAVPSLTIGPVPFTPDNDGIDDQLSIQLELPASSGVTIDIYGFDGRVLKRYSGVPREVYLWDGSGTSGAAPPGPFFVVAEITTGSKTRQIRKKGILWRK